MTGVEETGEVVRSSKGSLHGTNVASVKSPDVPSHTGSVMKYKEVPRAHYRMSGAACIKRISLNRDLVAA